MTIIHGDKSEYLIKREKLARFLFWLLFVVFGIVGIIQIVLSFIYRGQHIKSLIIVVIFSSIVLYIAKRAEKKAVEGLKFKRGRKGEGAIYYELFKLSYEYYVFQGIKFTGQGDIDFVVVGPTGIFTIEVKSHKGGVDFQNGHLTRYSKPFEKDFLKQARGEAFSLNKYIKDNIGEDVFVDPIVVFASNQARVRFGLRKVQNVYVVGRRFLRKVIYKETGNLSHEKIERISNALKVLVKK